MTKRRRRQPTDPAEIARRKAERERYTKNTPSEWGVNEEALASQEDVHSESATRTKVRRVQRFDVFRLLASRKSIEEADLANAERFQVAIALAYRASGSVSLDRVDCAGATGELKWLEAADDVRSVLALLSPHDGKLLLALCIPDMVLGQRHDWKGIVRRERGLIDRDAQVRAVVGMCGALTAAYQEIDYGVRRAA